MHIDGGFYYTFSGALLKYQMLTESREVLDFRGSPIRIPTLDTIKFSRKNRVAHDMAVTRLHWN